MAMLIFVVRILRAYDGRSKLLPPIDPGAADERTLARGFLLFLRPGLAAEHLRPRQRSHCRAARGNAAMNDVDIPVDDDLRTVGPAVELLHDNPSLLWPPTRYTHHRATRYPHWFRTTGTSCQRDGGGEATARKSHAAPSGRPRTEFPVLSTECVADTEKPKLRQTSYYQHEVRAVAARRSGHPLDPETPEKQKARERTEALREAATREPTTRVRSQPARRTGAGIVVERSLDTYRRA
jgi:hypothetical protein